MNESDVLNLLAKEAIKEVMARYAQALDSHDTDVWVACFAEDGTLDEPPPVGHKVTGRPALREFMETYLKTFPISMHIGSNHLIEVKGDRAHSVSQMVLISRAKRTDEHDSVIRAIYHDDFVRQDGQWFIAYRKLLVQDPSLFVLPDQA